MTPRRPRTSRTALIVALLVLAPIAAIAWWLVRRGRRHATTTRSAGPSVTRRDSSMAHESTSRAPTPTGAPGRPGVGEDRPRYRLRGLGTARTAITCLALAVLIGVPTTWATLSDQVTTATVSVGGGTVNVPTGITTSQNGSSSLRVTWGAPAAGLAPDAYDVYRSTTAGSFPSILSTPAASPFDDTTAVECTDYYYTVRSRRVNLVSVAGTQAGPLQVDYSAPSVATANAHVIFDPLPLPKVADFIRTSPGNVEVYAQVTDNCATSGLNVSFTFGAPFSTTVAATFGSWQPIAGGPTYNYRYTTTNVGLANAANLAWTVTATDPAGNATTVAGTPATGDGVGPALDPTAPAEIVSGQTNFYSTGLGYGEVVSAGGSAALRTAGFWTYANLVDAAGVSSATADISALRTGGAATALVKGAYASDNGVAWGWRTSAVTVPTVTATNGSMQNFTISATDVLGNAATSTNQQVEIDQTPVAAAAASCSNTGNTSNTLNSGDFTTWNFGDTVDPSSLLASWTGGAASTITGTVIARNNNTSDFVSLNTDFGLTMFTGATYNTSFTLGATNWVTANVNIPSSTFSLIDRMTARLAYGAPASGISDRNSTTTHYFSTSIRDAAGNPVAAGFSETCATSAW
ncbi:MAG: hypothetical protein JWN72_179 [Thermoleophilia bacterium]|nr:hypothetical protein [Thermoleophilia bacterium]